MPLDERRRRLIWEMMSVAAAEPTLYWDFLATQRLHPDMSFARASKAWDPVTGAERADDVPRLVPARGLFLEAARTNRFLYSDDFSNAYWNKTRCTVTATNVAAPDGTLTACRIRSDTSSSTSILERLNAQTGGSYTAGLQPWGFWLKGEGASIGKTVSLVTYQGNSPAQFVHKNITLTADWQRVEHVVDTTGQAFFFPGLYLRAGPGSATLDDTETVLVWGAQLESNVPALSSRIATGASMVTRAAETAQVTPLGSWYQAGAGTLFVETETVNGAFNPADFPVLASFIKSADANNRLYIVGAPTPTRLRGNVVTGATAGTDASHAYTVGTGKAAFAWPSAAGGPTTLALNGVAAAGVSSASGVAADLDRLVIGQHLGGLSALNGYVRRVAYWPRKLVDADLARLTQ